jgi:hypothetical protein
MMPLSSRTKGEAGRMKTRASLIAFATAAFMSGACLGADAPILEPGEYKVSVRLELPHIKDAVSSKVASVCLTGSGNGTHGLSVLSDNNPLGACPSSNIREDGGTLTFDIVCPGVNEARGLAKYAIGPQSFDGEIDMKMGGKNMTMTERQSGHRVGDCRAPNSPRT